MQDFTKLRAWEKAHQLALDVIRALPPGCCRGVPGLRPQAIRAALSVPANLAEGCGKLSPGELGRYADIACGSLSELRSHLRLARDSGAVGQAAHDELERSIDVVRRMLTGLARVVRDRRDASAGNGTHTPHLAPNGRHRLPDRHGDQGR